MEKVLEVLSNINSLDNGFIHLTRIPIFIGIINFIFRRFLRIEFNVIWNKFLALSTLQKFNYKV